MPAFKPLSARSVLLSLVLGAPSQGMSPSQLTQAGGYFGISPATVRVALTRAVARDELRREGANYHLGDRLLARRQRQDEHTAVVPWDGTWEVVVAVTPGRPSSDRAALRNVLAGARLAELREGVWMRPANLLRVAPGADDSDVKTFRARSDEDPAALAAQLWDLPAWADETRHTLDLLASTVEPAERLAVAAHLVRHLATDPLLPPELWPDAWPEQTAQDAYARYQEELRAVTHG